MSKNKDIHFPMLGSRANPAREIEAAKERRDKKKVDEPPANIHRMKIQRDSGIFFGLGAEERQAMKSEPSRDPDKLIANGEDFKFIMGKKTAPPAAKKPSHRYVGKPINMDGHVAVLGGTGSGKGTCIAIPTMRSWGENPMVVLDVKGDLYKQWMEMKIPSKRDTKVFNPSEDSTCTYDPFSFIKGDDESNRASNLRELVGAIIPLSPDSKHHFWDKAARKILTGALLYYLDLGKEVKAAEGTEKYTDVMVEVEFEECIEVEKEVNFYTAIDCITSISTVELFEKINKSENKAAKKYIRSFSGKDNLTDSEMLMDINETLDTHLMEFINDNRIKRALAQSEQPDNTINWETDIKTHNIFLTIPEDKIDQWGSILNMMLTQLVRSLERRSEKYSTEYEKPLPLLLLLDEFPRIGQMDVLANALSTLRSKNVTILLLAQSLNQISALYGSDVSRVMLDNCDFKAVLRVNDPDNQRYFSELAGTIPTESKSHGYNRSDEQTSYNESLSESREPFIRPEEFAHLDKEMILYTPYGTYRVEKVPYHDPDRRAKVFGAI